MVHGKKLQVLPDADRVEDALVAAAAERGGFADGSGFLTFGQLIERLDGAAQLARRPASKLASRVALWACAQRLGPGPFGPFVHEPAFARAALDFVFELKSGNLSPPAFLDAVERLPPARAVRARYLAALYAAYEAKLAELQLADREDLVRGALERLRAPALPPLLRGVSAIEVRHLHDFPPLRLELLMALAKRCEEAGITFALEVPAAGSPDVDMAVDPALAAFEKRWQQAVHLEVRKADLIEERPLGRMGQFLFSPMRKKGSAKELAGALEVASAPTPIDECRALARRAAELIAEGEPPEQIAIAFRDLGDEAEAVAESLEELGIPARIRLGAPLGSTAAGRVALELPLVVDDGFPADRVAWLLGSRYVPAVSKEAPGSPGTLLALASVRDDVVGASGDKGAYQVRLAQLAGRLEKQGREGKAKAVRALLAQCAKLFSLCRQMPEEARAADLLQRWWGCLEELGLFNAMEKPEQRDAEGSALGRAVLRALARDQATGESLKAMAEDFGSALVQTGAGTQPMQRRIFQRWLVDAAADYNLSPRGPRGGAVRVMDLREMAGRSFAHVCVGGLTDGRLPGRGTTHPLFPDEDRRILNINLGREVFRLTAGEFDGRLPWRLAEDRLLFFLALAATRGAVTLTYPRMGASGQEHVRSPFLDEVQRLTGVAPEDLPARPLPLLDEVLTERQLQERVALEVLARPDVRISKPDDDAPALKIRFGPEPWLKLAQEHTSIEEERLRFFSDPNKEPRAYSGQVGGPEVAEDIAQLFAFGPDHPLSATTVDRFGNCAFQGFLSYALRLDEPEQPGEEIDARGLGSFWHRILEVLFPRLKAEGLLGKPVEDVPDALLDEVLEKARRDAEETVHVGHPALWRLGQDRARLMMRRLLASEMRGLPFELHEPSRTELRFGRKDSPEGWQTVSIPGPAGQPPIHLEGKIDRLDDATGSLGIVDYKSGSLDSKPKLWDKLLVSEFQLPIYLYAARASGHEGALQAALLGLKHGEVRHLHELVPEDVRQTLDELISADPAVAERLEERGGKNLVAAIQKLVAGLREGQFPARPQDCRFCSYRAVCRISERALEEEGS